MATNCFFNTNPGYCAQEIAILFVIIDENANTDLTLVTRYPQQGTERARTSMEWHGAALSQFSTPAKRARTQTIVSSKVPYSNTNDKLGAIEHAILFRVAVQNSITDSYLRIAIIGRTE